MRDEMAKLVWAIDQITPSAFGTPTDQPRIGQSAPRVPVDVTDLVDRVATPIAPNWHPYLPRRAGGEAPSGLRWDTTETP